MPERLRGRAVWQEITGIVVAAETSDYSGQVTSESSSAVPTIVVNDRFLRDITGDCIATIHRINGETPQVYVRGNALTRLLHGDQDVTAEALDRYSLKGVLDRAVNFMRLVESKGQVTESPGRPPDDVIADLLSLSSYDLPVLNSIAGAPVLLPDSKILLTEGYEWDSGIYLHLNGLNARINCDWPVEKCLDIIFNDLLVDFPLSNQGSRAHVLALMLLPFIRPYIDEPTPLHLLDAPSRGTGKGLLADVIAVIGLGVPAWVMALSRDENEMRKSITSVLMAGSPMILLDNVHRLDSSNLCAVLTTTRWRDRLLGRSKIVEVPNLSIWIATGNNVTLSDEMATDHPYQNGREGRASGGAQGFQAQRPVGVDGRTPPRSCIRLPLAGQQLGNSGNAEKQCDSGSVRGVGWSHGRNT
jgi:hypothetical protein